MGYIYIVVVIVTPFRETLQTTTEWG